MSPIPLGVLASARVGNSWTPASLPNIAAWWDASDSSTLSLSGSTVTQWRDKTGSGYHWQPSAGTPTLSTVPSGPCVAFEGNARMLTDAFAERTAVPSALLAVARDRATTGQRILVIQSHTTSGLNDGRLGRYADGSVAAYKGDWLISTAWGTGLRSVAVLFNGASSRIAVDSTTWTTSGTTGNLSVPVTRLSLGAYGGSDVEFWLGDICEAAWIVGTLAEADLAAWTTYTRAKWGTP